MKLISLVFGITIFLTLESTRVSGDFESYGVVIGPNIPVYHLERSSNWYYDLKIKKFDQVFTTSNSYNYYNNPRQNNESDIYFPRILIITDVDMYMRYDGNITKIINNLTYYLDYADECFQRMKRYDDPKIKLSVAALITSEEMGIPPLQLQPIFENPELQALRDKFKLNGGTSQTDYYINAKESLIKIENWFKSHDYYFKDIQYDFFIYISSWLLAQINEYYPERIVPAMSMEWKCVSDKNSLETPYNMIVNSVIDEYGYYAGKLISHVTHNPDCF